MANEVFLYMHEKRLPNGCGGVAFAYDHLPNKHEELLVGHVVPFNGSVPSAYEPILCATCGGDFPATYTFPIENFVAYKS